MGSGGMELLSVFFAPLAYIADVEERAEPEEWNICQLELVRCFQDCPRRHGIRVPAIGDDCVVVREWHISMEFESLIQMLVFLGVPEDVVDFSAVVENEFPVIV